MKEELQKGDRVRVVKNRVRYDPIFGKTGQIVGKTDDLKFFWVIHLDEETYADGDTGELLYPDEIKRIEETAMQSDDERLKAY